MEDFYGEKKIETIFFTQGPPKKGGSPLKSERSQLGAAGLAPATDAASVRVFLKTYVVKTWKLNGSSNYVTDNYYNDFINEACSIIEQMRIIFFGIVQGFP